MSGTVLPTVSAALAGALEEIGRLRGGTVALFEQDGFERTRRIDRSRWVVRKVV